MTKLTVGAVIVLLVVILPLAGCRERAPAASKGKLQVITTLFPVYDFTRAVGGEHVQATLLLPPGVEPHNYEPKPEEVARISRAPLFIYTDQYMEPWATSILNGTEGDAHPLVVEAGRGVTFLPATAEGEHHHDDRHGPMDPHIWLDPLNARLMVDNIAAALAQKDPANASYYRANAERYKGQLTALHDEFRTGLASCRHTTFLHGGHSAFAYLANRYGLTYRSAYAVSANAEPTPQRVVELVREMRRLGLGYIFSEEFISPAMAETIAHETGAKILKLHGVHNVTKSELERGVTYLSLMEENLKNLRTGLECR